MLLSLKVQNGFLRLFWAFLNVSVWSVDFNNPKGKEMTQNSVLELSWKEGLEGLTGVF